MGVWPGRAGFLLMSGSKREEVSAAETEFTHTLLILFIKSCHSGMGTVLHHEWLEKSTKASKSCSKHTGSLQSKTCLCHPSFGISFIHFFHTRLYISLIIHWSVHHIYAIYLAVLKYYSGVDYKERTPMTVHVHCILHKDFCTQQGGFDPLWRTHCDWRFKAKQAVVSSEQRNTPDELWKHATAVLLF